MKNFKLYEEFLNESTENYVTQDLALITVRYLYQNKPDYVISREQFLSQDSRQKISKEWGKRLPNGFPGPEKGMPLGNLLATISVKNPGWQDTPYFDDASLVFDITGKLVFRCKVVNRSIASTWEDLGNWLKKNIINDNFLGLWLDSDLSLADFKEKYKGRITGNKFGL